MTKEMKRPTSHISGNSIKPALSKAVEFYTDNNRQAYECIRERDEYINHLESQLNNAKPQQALPVVPECVGNGIARDKQSDKSIAEVLKDIFTVNDKDLKEAGLWVKNNPEKYIIARNIGYTVEKPQLFEVKMPIVYWDDDASQLTNGFDFLRIDKETDEVDFVGFLSNTKKHTVHFTEQEIKSIDERYWQFAVPVEDGE
ncbi:DUF1642 domain-containing protein [Lactococcus lactis]|uniref:DUF1642 domain-containing protein n=1 Tax=Lactococcus lactis TaxID=1358 RepID=UPI0022B88262|nr:DUF1642 domain-containing protein [Lactococcus lactis]MCZ8491995.1 DUF1642 domain-containing protein [Lactococcus lactis]